MSTNPNVNEQKLNFLESLTEQQKNQRTVKMEKKSKQTLDKNLAESFEPITKKLQKVNDCTKAFEKVLTKTDSEKKFNKK